MHKRFLFTHGYGASWRLANQLVAAPVHTSVLMSVD